MSNSTESTALIGIDWGTTRLRAYRIGAEGKILERRDSDQGVAAIQDRAFERVLQEHIAEWRSAGNSNTPVLLCGMIGSRQGWREMPYLACPASLGQLSRALEPLESASGTVFLVAGLSARDEHGQHDVMRGEETQIMGVASGVGRQLIISPGTHSKWSLVSSSTVESFRTYMTGEIFALLRQHSVLGWLMGRGEAAADRTAFREGVQLALKEPDLLHTLFSVRTRGLFEGKSAEALSGYLSGLLIGGEVAGAVRHFSGTSATIIATEALGSWYQMALAAAGFTETRFVESDEAVARGLWRLWQART